MESNIKKKFASDISDILSGNMSLNEKKKTQKPSRGRRGRRNVPTRSPSVKKYREDYEQNVIDETNSEDTPDSKSDQSPQHHYLLRNRVKNRSKRNDNEESKEDSKEQSPRRSPRIQANEERKAQKKEESKANKKRTKTKKSNRRNKQEESKDDPKPHDRHKPSRNAYISSDDANLEERKRQAATERAKEEAENLSDKENDSDYIIEYDKDIVSGRLMKHIRRLIKKEHSRIQYYYELIETVRFDRNKVVTLNGKQYYCMSDTGLEMIRGVDFPNLRKRYNILHTIFEVQDNPAVLEYVENNRNYFAIWTYAACFIDHDKFEKFLYHVLVNHKSQREEIEDIHPIKLSDIEPITHSRFLYTAGKCLLKYNAKIYRVLKKQDRVLGQSENCIEAFDS
ncbi:unnamed protein product [Moneuplotes crassus]|uniref:Uncharacterized protein n=1 Tax=Euplotes crassus TaxID=5936 RepID=A0AAD1XCS4_EUPCR|nr:unnamed protein product [Moneuplotes crassus]